MLSPDNYIQSPLSSQSYNRYAYCLNNPLIYTDPSGELIFIDPGMENGAVSMGGYITLHPDEGQLGFNNETLVHEYGHFIQTRDWGGLSTLLGAVFSGVSAADLDWRSTNMPDEIWVEQDANARALDYFGDEMTAQQINNYTRPGAHPNQAYDDLRFLRNILFPDLLLIIILL